MHASERIRELLAINHALAGAVDFDEVLRLVVGKTAELTRARACAMLLREEPGLARIAAVEGGRASAEGTRLQLDEQIEAHLRAVLGLGDEARFSGAPVVGPDGVIGALALFHGEDEAAGCDEELLAALADQAAIALENARRLERLENAFAVAHAERQELAAVMEAAPVAILLVEGEEGRVSYANRFATALLGGSVGSSLATLPASWRSPDGAPITGAQSPIVRALRAGERTEGVELVVESSEGERRLELNAAPLARDGRGRQRAVVAVRDVTAREHLRREQAHAEQLAEANRAKDLFFNTLSHELRTPLAAIRNATELMRRSAADEQKRERAVSIVERCVGQQARLIEDLVDLSRIMLGRLQLQRAALDFAQLVGNQVEALEGEARRKGLELHSDLGEEPLVVRGDRDRLGQVVNNLLTNAIRYTPAGRIDVAARLEAGKVVLEVRDTGVGLSAQALDCLFKPFHQADPSLRRSEGGLGIGLSIVRSLTERHEGTIEARSDGPGKGSCFTVRLPALLEADKLSEREEARIEGARRAVLVVEDNADLRESLVELLTEWGHRVVAAGNGAAAIAAVERDRYDFALVDIGLPDIDGFEIGRRLRELAGGLRLVALTGFVNDAQRDRALGAGFDQFLAKPVDLRSLERLLAGQAGVDESPPG